MRLLLSCMSRKYESDSFLSDLFFGSGDNKSRAMSHFLCNGKVIKYVLYLIKDKNKNDSKPIVFNLHTYT